MMNFRLLSLTDCPSTNTLAKEMAKCALSENRIQALEGTVVLAERQSGGRGRIGRSFFSPEGGLYFSLILAPTSLSFDSTLVTTIAAVAMIRALQKDSPQTDVRIKWVNDLLIQDKKICGILTESVSVGDKTALILGCGLNYAADKNAFPEEIRDIATSLHHISTPVAQKNALLFHFLEEFEYFYRLLPDTSYLDLYRAKSCLIGETVFFQNPADKNAPFALQSARVTGIGPKAELLLEQNGPDGTARRFSLAAGEVSVRLTPPQ